MLSINFHKAGAFLLALFYLAIMLKPLAPVIHYTANYGVYSNELCENKDVPELHCNGTCQLSKMLASINPKQDTPSIIPTYEGLQWYIGWSSEAPTNQRDILDSKSTLTLAYLESLINPNLSIATPPPQAFS